MQVAPYMMLLTIMIMTVMMSYAGRNWYDVAEDCDADEEDGDVSDYDGDVDFDKLS